MLIPTFPRSIDYGDLDRALKILGFTGNPSIVDLHLHRDDAGRYQITVRLPDGEEDTLPVTATVISSSFGITP